MPVVLQLRAGNPTEERSPDRGLQERGQESSRQTCNRDQLAKGAAALDGWRGYRFGWAKGIGGAARQDLPFEPVQILTNLFHGLIPAVDVLLKRLGNQTFQLIWELGSNFTDGLG